jgi:hypothetical protein
MNYAEIHTDLGLLHPLVLFCMANAFAFSFFLNLLISFLLFARQKVLSFILFIIVFMVAAILPVFLLFHLGFENNGKEVITVGVGGFPFSFIFEMIPPMGGLALSIYLYINRTKIRLFSIIYALLYFHA